jgi:hypothetical protein
VVATWRILRGVKRMEFGERNNFAIPAAVDVILA